MAINETPPNAGNTALLYELKAQLAAHGNKYLIGFSGGLDSTVLLHAVAKIPGLQLRAIHIHHGLHADADQWIVHCTNVCDELNIELVVVKVEVEKDSGTGVEAAARRARYQAIAEHIHDNEILLTAHHLQDQAETVLLRLLRGSGSQGLAGMRMESTAHGFEQLRPLLSVSKTELQSYADREKLNWIDDPSNEKTHFDRNYLRHEILPLLEKRWPQANLNLARSAELLAEEHQCLREQSGRFLAEIQNVDANVLSVTGLLKHSKAWRAQILRCWTESQETPPLPANILQAIEQSLLHAKADAEASVNWSGCEISRWRDGLYLSELHIEMPPDWQQDWKGSAAFVLPNGDRWGFVSMDTEVDLSTAVQKYFSGNLLVKFRRGGEKILLPNREHHSAIKNCLQELGVPPWERRRLPLLFSPSGDCLAAGDIVNSGLFEAFCETYSTRFARIV